MKDSPNENELRIKLQDLRKELASIDFWDDFTESNEGGDFGFELLLKKDDSIKIRMDACQNHKRPHVHVDYGTELHAVSISIRDRVVMVGEIPRKFLKAVLKWVEANETLLIEIWETLQNGDDAELLVELLSK